MATLTPWAKALKLALAASTIVLLTAACGGNGEPVPTFDLTPAGEAGLLAARTAGCGPCHGSNGEGVDGLGPPLIGLFGSEVFLEGGGAIRANRDYLSRAITDPDVEVVEGYGLPMPPYQLEAADLEAILDYLEEIG